MTHHLTPDLARAHRSDLRRSAATSRLVALAQCCRPSRIRAAFLARYSRSARQVACCA